MERSTRAIDLEFGRHLHANGAWVVDGEVLVDPATLADEPLEAAYRAAVQPQILRSGASRYWTRGGTA